MTEQPDELYDAVVETFENKSQDDLSPKEIAFALDREGEEGTIEAMLAGSDEFQFSRTVGVDRYYVYVGGEE